MTTTKVNDYYYLSGKLRELNEDKKMKAKGYHFRTDLWIHPKNGGDDRQKIAYTELRPTEKEILSMLRNSEIKTDFKITEL